jgi:hypothetical protein
MVREEKTVTASNDRSQVMVRLEPPLARQFRLSLAEREDTAQRVLHEAVERYVRETANAPSRSRASHR